VIWLLIPALAGCRDPRVAPYGGWPAWVELDLSGAEDLGHRPGHQDLGPPGPLAFEEVGAASGLDGVIGGGNTHGVGLALVDLDADGWLDLVVANGVSNATGVSTPSRLLWNAGDGTFVDGTDALGLEGRDLYSVAAGDVDNDGWVDLYFGGQPLDVLLRNLGDRTFVDVSASSGAAGPPSDPGLVDDGRSKIVSIGDIDRDGWQDLVSATSTRPAPGIAVLRNRGGGAFEDVTAATGAAIAPDGHPCAVMFTDYDNDGWRDLWVWNDRGGHTLLHNVDGAFDDLRNRADRVSIRNPMGVDAADIDHDGDLDYYVSNIGDHPLLVNQGDGTFEDRTVALGTAGDFGWGLAFEDFDLDGWADLLVTQEDARPILVYRNEAGTGFSRREVPVPPVVSGGAAHNVPAAFGDVDGDGRIDAVWARTDGTGVQLLRNVTEVGGRHWLEVRVDETPGTGERGGVGARVVVGIDGEVQFRDITGGASRASQSALAVRFGLDGWDGVDWVLVLWPDGRQRTFVDVPADGTLIVR
jgi:enediyne biosynthesis protein E4